MRSCVANGQTDGRTDGTEPNSMDTSASSGVQNRETFLSLLLRDQTEKRIHNSYYSHNSCKPQAVPNIHRNSPYF